MKSPIHWALSPGLEAGVLGVTDNASSSLSYRGASVGLTARLEASGERMEAFLLLGVSYAETSNPDRSISARDWPVSVQAGYRRLIRTTGKLSFGIGGALGFGCNMYLNKALNTFSAAMDADVMTSFSAELALKGRWSLYAEDNLPVASFISSPNMYWEGLPPLRSVFAFKAFAGNDLRAGARLRSGNGNSLSLAFYFNSRASDASEYSRICLQRCGLCLSYRFGLSRQCRK